MNRRNFFKMCGTGLVGVAGVALLGKPASPMPTGKDTGYKLGHGMIQGLVSGIDVEKAKEIVKSINEHPEWRSNSIVIPSTEHGENVFYNLWGESLLNANTPRGGILAWQEFLKQHPKINNNNPSGLYSEAIYFRAYKEDVSIKPAARFWLKQVKLLPDNIHSVRVYLVEEIDQYKYATTEVYCNQPNIIKNCLETYGWKFVRCDTTELNKSIFRFVKA